MNHLKIMLIELYEFQKSVLSFHLFIHKIY